MAKAFNYSAATVKIYHGYGHKDNLIVYGHIFAGKLPIRKKYKNGFAVLLGTPGVGASYMGEAKCR